jgi:phosphoserine phosphatase
VEEIVPDDLPLAVLPDATFGPARAVGLAPGDMLVLVTDGFFEWARAGAAPERFGLERLRASLAAHAGKPPAALIEAVAADVTAFAGGEPQQDDLTMVVVRRSQRS